MASSADKLYDKTGGFHRPQSQFRSRVSSELGSQYLPEANRYHLYVSWACPWAHRVLIVRKLKGLEDLIPVTSVHHFLDLEKGWRFATQTESDTVWSITPDPLHEDIRELRELYLKSEPSYEGRYTVPVLWDKKTESIVNNESSEIIRMLNTAFDSLLPEEKGSPTIDLYPEILRSSIDETNAWHYDHINNGVYKTGAARSQEAYETAITALFESIARAEQQLSESRGPYYFGDVLTECDVRLFVTIVRFDPVYVQHFKCNIADIRSGFPALHKWLRNLYWKHEAFLGTTNFEYIKKHYMESHVTINPRHIVAVGPVPHILKEDQEVAACRGSKKA